MTERQQESVENKCPHSAKPWVVRQVRCWWLAKDTASPASDTDANTPDQSGNSATSWR